MKRKFQILIIALTVLSLTTYAKGNSSGIYFSAADYKSNKLAYESACDKGKHIQFHDFFRDSPEITIKTESEKIRLKKDSIYGYRDCNNEAYRFYKHAAYRIAEPGNIYIYTQQNNITQNKGFKVVNVYYFSAGADGEIIPLTLDNLKSAYSNDEPFLSLLDQFFNNEDVSAYDNLHKTFKVNYLYVCALKQDHKKNN